MDGIDGASIWCGHGVLAHNLVKVGGLVAAKQQHRPPEPGSGPGVGPNNASRPGQTKQQTHRPIPR
jgi:hypothetical protein